MSMDREISSWELRRRLEEQILSMKPEQRLRCGRRQVEEAYPPVGEDGSTIAAFRSMALAYAGNRPEPNLTSEDRFRQFLARNGFEVIRIDRFEDWIEIGRSTEECSNCHGVGRLMVLDDAGPACAPSGDFSPTATITAQIQPCQPCGGHGYLPAKGDPDARVGDYAASDAWIERKRRERADP